MIRDFAKEIAGHTLEYFDTEHQYLIDGVMVPSITQILKHKFGNRFANIDADTLKRAAQAGTEVHEAIEQFCKTGRKSKHPETRSFAFLQKQYGFEVVESETPVILSLDGEPIAAGRVDLVLEMRVDGRNVIGGADIKRTSTLDKEYIAYQLNLYRIAYRQSYGVDWEFLRGVHLHNDTRKFVTIPIDEVEARMFLREWRAKNGID